MKKWRTDVCFVCQLINRRSWEESREGTLTLPCHYTSDYRMHIIILLRILTKKWRKSEFVLHSYIIEKINKNCLSSYLFCWLTKNQKKNQICFGCLRNCNPVFTCLVCYKSKKTGICIWCVEIDNVSFHVFQ